MAKKLVCDICGTECTDSGRYELIYKCWIRTEREDICFSCIQKIKSIIKENKKNGDKESFPQKVVKQWF